MIVITGATGQLGRLVVDELLRRNVAAKDIAVVVRNAGKASDLKARGVDVRVADYDVPETLTSAFAGADRVLLISGNEVGKRIAQHRAVIDAVRKSGARLLAYTSILHGDASRIALASEHIATERMIRESGVPFVFLRNGWYIENYLGNLGAALEHGAVFGSSGAGRIAGATRADYAAAAAAVMAGSGHENKIYELAGDTPFSMEEVAAEISRAAGKSVVYNDLPHDEYEKFLVGVGLPKPHAATLADADQGVKRGELDDRSGDLRRLIGRPTTTLRDAVTAALQKAEQTRA
jgi:NAD(P)H dehydrogenase (quinone)